MRSWRGAAGRGLMGDEYARTRRLAVDLIEAKLSDPFAGIDPVRDLNRHAHARLTAVLVAFAALAVEESGLDVRAAVEQIGPVPRMGIPDTLEGLEL